MTSEALLEQGRGQRRFLESFLSPRELRHWQKAHTSQPVSRLSDGGIPLSGK